MNYINHFDAAVNKQMIFPPCSYNSICVLDFPHCVVHEMPELTAESLVSQNT